MPTTIKGTIFKYKNPSGNYVGVNVLSERATSEQIALINAEGDRMVNVLHSTFVKQTEKAAANGVATLDTNVKIPVAQLPNIPASLLPSIADDVLEFDTRQGFPATGERGKIYVALNSNLLYRWTGSTYLEFATSLIDDTSGVGAARKTWSANKLAPLFTSIDGNIASILSRMSSAETRLDDLEYIPIEITSFAASPNLVEDGSTQTAASLAYVLNRDASSMKLDNEAIPNTAASDTISLTGLSLTASKTWTLSATDNRNRTVTRNATMTFTNKVKYGVATVPSAINDAFLNGLPTRTLSTGKVRSISVTAGAGQYVWYALPVSYGTCKFTVGGFTGGFTQVAQFNHQNESGKTVEYRVYRSDNPNLGAQTISIS